MTTTIKDEIAANLQAALADIEAATEAIPWRPTQALKESPFYHLGRLEGRFKDLLARLEKTN